MNLPTLDAATMDLPTMLAALGKTAGIGAVPPDAPTPLASPTPMDPMPAMPPSMPTSMSPTVPESGMAKALKSLAPLIFAGIAAKQGGPLSSAALLKGMADARQYRDKQQREQAELDARNATTAESARLRMAELDQRKQADALAFRQKTIEGLDAHRNAADRAQYIALSEAYGMKAYGLPTGWLSGLPMPDTHEEDVTRARALVDLAKKTHGDRYNDFIANDPVVDFQGQQVPFSRVAQLAGLGLTGADGKVIPQSTKANEPVDAFERFWQKTYLPDAEERLGKPVAQWTKAELKRETLQAKKELNQADDRPTDSTLIEIRNLQADLLRRQQNAGMTPAQFNQAQSLANDYNGNQQTKDYQTRYSAYGTILATQKSGPSAAGDLSLVFAYMKMLDPGSTVREGEQASAANARGVPDWVRSLYNNIVTGQRLTPSQRKDFSNRARDIYGASKNAQTAFKKTFDRRAVAQGLPPDAVTFMFDDPDGSDAPRNAGSAPSGAVVVVGKDGASYTFPTQKAADDFKKAGG
jgi:hypothetical protein